MKIKFLISFFIFICCSSNTTTNIIEINQNILNNLQNLETNETINLDSTSYTVINYWASWCLECIEEHQYLIQLSKTKGFENQVYLVSFQDSKENAIDFINKYGRGEINYVTDPESKMAINSGVFGVPETHVLLNNEIIKKFIGPLSLENLQEIIISYSNE
jgi:cytochrome c biogenesis protein CcmG/thiol:disulfide interchange protein DsbE